MHKNRAQFLIIIALVLSVVLISITLLTYKTTTTVNIPSTNTEWYLTLNIEQDFPRVLAKALAKATSDPDTTNETASNVADDELDLWKQAFTVAYVLEDVTFNISPNVGTTLSSGHNRDVDITDIDAGSTSTKTYYIPDLLFSGYVLLRWQSPEAISAISASIRVNCKSSGLYGWNYTALVFLNVTILSISKKSDQYNITLLVMNERGPVEDLDKSNFLVNDNEPDIYIYGGGKYVLSFTTSSTTVDVTVKDNRGIYVYIKNVELEG